MGWKDDKMQTIIIFVCTIVFLHFSPIATPVAVPSRRRGFSECSRGIRTSLDSLSESPKHAAEYLHKATTLTPSEENYFRKSKCFISKAGFLLSKISWSLLEWINLSFLVSRDEYFTRKTYLTQYRSKSKRATYFRKWEPSFKALHNFM